MKKIKKVKNLFFLTFFTYVNDVNGNKQKIEMKKEIKMKARKMTAKELKKVLHLHQMWLDYQDEGAAADLSYVDLRGVHLKYANLENANLRGADLRGANLRNANLWNADLRGANLRNANLWDTIGNECEIKTLIASQYIVNWTAYIVQIGCEQHTRGKWLAFDDAGISEMAYDALEWWTEWKPKLIALGVFRETAEDSEMPEN